MKNQDSPPSVLLPAIIVSVILGLVAALTLSVVGIPAFAFIERRCYPNLLGHFWHSLIHGVGVGVGVAVGYTLLNWIIGATDRGKNDLGL